MDFKLFFSPCKFWRGRSSGEVTIMEKVMCITIKKAKYTVLRGQWRRRSQILLSCYGQMLKRTITHYVIAINKGRPSYT